VGQVPVVQDQEIIGVVTRTDLIKLWAAPSHQPPRRHEIARKIEAALPQPLVGLLRQASQLAEEMEYPLYVVGGFVRDLLIDVPNLDMDLVVEGNAIKLARKLGKQVGARVRTHGRFGTAKIILEDSETGYGIPSLDFATARTEFYAHSAALPEVERSSIKADLHRRDFTINTLAIRLDQGNYGKLLDFYAGEQDLRAGLIRVLHSLSFIEDPTRIMRAARFEQRLEFRIEARTAELIDNALPMLLRVTGERVRHELYKILREREPEKALCRLDSLNVLVQIHPRLSCLETTWELFARLRQTLSSGRWAIAPNDQGRPEPGLYLALLTYLLPRPELEGLIDRLKIFRDDLDLLRQVHDLQEREEALSQPQLLNHEIYELLRYATTPALLIVWLCTSSDLVRERLWRYEQELRHVEPLVDGAYLKGLGLRPSPIFRRLLHAVRDARLDGLIQTIEEEKALIDRLLAQEAEE
jgi:tRNA nucleotidyltransferase (CCA-adding enzyme)